MSSFAPIRGTRAVINSTPIVDGQFLIETDQTNTTGNKIYLDNGSTRIHVGGAREASDIVYDNTETSTIINATDVQNAIDETVSAIENIMGDVAYIEPTTTVTKTGGYAVGNYLICLALGTKLYKVTTAIASGGTINATSGTGNVTETTVADELATLNSNLSDLCVGYKLMVTYSDVEIPTGQGQNTLTFNQATRDWISDKITKGLTVMLNGVVYFVYNKKVFITPRKAIIYSNDTSMNYEYSNLESSPVTSNLYMIIEATTKSSNLTTITIE